MEIQKLTAENNQSSTLLQFIYWLIKIGTQLKIDDQSQENLAELDNELLKTSAILFVYHSRLTDALILPITLRNELPHLDKMLGPVAISHYQGWQKIGLDLISATTGAVPIPIIRKKDEQKFSAEKKTELFAQLTQKTDSYLTRPGNVYGIAPMGTRAHILDSSKVSPSFAKLAHNRQLPAVPMALTHTDGRASLKVGESLAPTNSDQVEEITNYYMSQLARLIPIELRGDYS